MVPPNVFNRRVPRESQLGGGGESGFGNCNLQREPSELSPFAGGCRLIFGPKGHKSHEVGVGPHREAANDVPRLCGHWKPEEKGCHAPDQLYFPWVANSFFSKIRSLAYRRRRQGRKILHTGLKIFHSEFFGRLEKEDNENDL